MKFSIIDMLNKTNENNVAKEFKINSPNLPYTCLYHIKTHSNFLTNKFLTEKNSINKLLESLIGNCEGNDSLDIVFEEFLSIFNEYSGFYGIKTLELAKKVGRKTVEEAFTSYYIPRKQFTRNSMPTSKIISSNPHLNPQRNICEKFPYFGSTYFNETPIIYLQKLPKLYIKERFNSEKSNIGFGDTHSSMSKIESISFK